MAWKDYSGDESGYRELIKKHHPDAKVGRGHGEGVTQHTVGSRDNVVGHYDSHHKTGKVKVYEGTIMKTFKEFVAESAGSGDHHKEALGILKKHLEKGTNVEQGDESGKHDGGTVKHHLTSLHPKHREGLHKALTGAGYTHKALKRDPKHSGAGNYDADSYHKGSTEVHVPHHTAWGQNGPGQTHHIVEVRTDIKKKG